MSLSDWPRGPLVGGLGRIFARWGKYTHSENWLVQESLECGTLKTDLVNRFRFRITPSH